MSESLGKGYKPWLIASLVVLVGSLGLLGGTVMAAFFYFGEKTSPLWVTVLGGFAVLGMLLGFGGFLVLMLIAGWKSFRDARRVQVIPPERHRG